ncbi:MAG: hypothetical protein A3F16_01435 [Deltaproteobacteria bacterium RIFCSPHIGHO2_12_FULL_43_9]|nr:MAG: hypothetical protein A3F16_01435 [Deltaproteobacteria bacterium RIFCSPHIGHO2_12_FULL_43_9]
MNDIIELKNIVKSFEGNDVCKGLNLTVEKGEILALIGGSGSGKTVILRHMIGLHKPDSGKVLFEGKDITDYDENELIAVRTKIAYLFQNGALFDSLSVFENVAYPLREHTKLPEEEIQKRVLEELKHLKIEGTEDLYPSDLSGGMQRRVAFARAIILKPDVILFDEPTTGLDPFNIHNVVESIRDLNRERGITCVVVTHDMQSMMKLADRIAMLHKGVIRTVGPTEEVRALKDPVVESFITGIEAKVNTND